jgi:hypothetical protein
MIGSQVYKSQIKEECMTEVKDELLPVENKWCCHNCKTVTIHPICPKRCFECHGSSFSQVAPAISSPIDRNAVIAVLRPFAKMAGKYDPPEDDDHDMPWDFKASDLHLGMLRKARDLLALIEQEGE